MLAHSEDPALAAAVSAVAPWPVPLYMPAEASKRMRGNGPVRQQANGCLVAGVQLLQAGTGSFLSAGTFGALHCGAGGHLTGAGAGTSASIGGSTGAGGGSDSMGKTAASQERLSQS